MSGLPFYIVDVFAQARYQGNQLAVFIGGDSLTTEQMQALAREMHYSETSFILSEGSQGHAAAGAAPAYRVRIFTPEHEVPFAGHPTLGTAHIIRTVLEESSPSLIRLSLDVGTIPVTCDSEGSGIPVYWMKQIEPQFGGLIGRDVLAGVIGLSPEDLDEKWPVQEVSTGMPHIIVPLRSLDALKRATVSREKCFDLLAKTWAKNILVFSPEPHSVENHLSVRMFADYLGIPEDPATGSGNGCLAGYLVKHRFFGCSNIDIRVEQGYEINRPSLLYLRAAERDGRIEVHVGGPAITVAAGELL